MPKGQDFNVVHNKNKYSVDLDRFGFYSRVVSETISQKSLNCISAEDSLEESDFILLLDAVNDVYTNINPSNIISLLKAAIVWDCPLIIEQIEKTLVDYGKMNLVIDAITIECSTKMHFPTLEKYAADNIEKLLCSPKAITFSSVVIHRILTWHQIPIERLTHLPSFLERHCFFIGKVATPIFASFPPSLFPVEMLHQLINLNKMDLDILGSDYAKYIEKYEQELETKADREQKKPNLTKSELKQVKSQLETKPVPAKEDSPKVMVSFEKIGDYREKIAESLDRIDFTAIPYVVTENAKTIISLDPKMRVAHLDLLWRYAEKGYLNETLDYASVLSIKDDYKSDLSILLLKKAASLESPTANYNLALYYGKTSVEKYRKEIVDHIITAIKLGSEEVTQLLLELGFNVY